MAKKVWTHDMILEFAGNLGKSMAIKPVDHWWGDAETKNEAAMNALHQSPDEIWHEVMKDNEATGGELQDQMVEAFIRAFEKALGSWPSTWESEDRAYET